MRLTAFASAGRLVPSALSVALVATLVGATGCAEPARVEVGLIHSPELNPQISLSSFTIRLFDGAGSEVQTISGEGGQIGMAAEVADLTLTEDQTYVLVLTAMATECGGAGTVSGRSLPFTHRAGDYVIPVQIGCSGRFSRAPSDAPSPRILGAAVGTGDGVVLAGGSSQLEFMPEGGITGYENPVRSIDRYDLRTGRFESIGDIAVPRFHPADAQLADGRVVLFGGLERVLGQDVCGRDIERVWPLDRPSVQAGLITPRCGAEAVRMQDSVVLMGGAPDQDAPPAVLFDSTLTATPTPVTGGVHRSFFSAVALGAGNLALLIGGTEETSAEIIEVTAAGANTLQATIEGELPEQWRSLSATYTSCQTGGGAVYVLGGKSVDALVNQVWCFLDRPEGGRLTNVGTIERGDEVVLAAESTLAGGPALLTVQGNVWSLIPVDPCSCGIAEASAVGGTLTSGDVLYSAGALTSMADGTVLLTGGVGVVDGPDAPMPPNSGIRARPETFIFFPDRP